jgi:hypothetical protein
VVAAGIVDDPLDVFEGILMEKVFVESTGVFTGTVGVVGLLADSFVELLEGAL